MNTSEFRATVRVTDVPQSCGYCSCDKTPGHDGHHRCRCGKLVDEPGRGCLWHTAGKDEEL